MAQASAYRARVEAAQLEETIASAPRALIAPLLVSFVIVFAFWDSPRRDLLLSLLAVVSCAAGTPIFIARRSPRARSRRAVRRGRWVAAGSGLAVGLVVATMPIILLGQADAARALILVTALELAIADAWLCGPLAAPGQLYVAPIAIGSAVVVADRGEAAVAAMLLLSAAGVAIVLRLRETIAAAALAAQMQVAVQGRPSRWLWRCGGSPPDGPQDLT